MHLQLINFHQFAALLDISSSPLQPVKRNEEAHKMNKTVGTDENSVEIWEMGRWSHQQ